MEVVGVEDMEQGRLRYLVDFFFVDFGVGILGAVFAYFAGLLLNSCGQPLQQKK